MSADIHGVPTDFGGTHTCACVAAAEAMAAAAATAVAAVVSAYPKTARGAAGWGGEGGLNPQSQKQRRPLAIMGLQGALLGPRGEGGAKSIMGRPQTPVGLIHVHADGHASPETFMGHPQTAVGLIHAHARQLQQQWQRRQ